VDGICCFGDMLGVDRDAGAAAGTEVRIGWSGFRQFIPLLTNRDISLMVRRRLYSSCVRGSMLHGSETWPMGWESRVTLRRAGMRMVGRMCGVRLQDGVPGGGLRETGIR